MIKHGSQEIQAVANATVPQITIQCGASFGAGNYGMCGRGFAPRFVFSWPSAQDRGDGRRAGGAARWQIVSATALARKGEPADEAQLEALQFDKIVATFERQADAFYTSGLLLDDGVIDPRDTRAVLALVPGRLRRGRARRDAAADAVRRRADPDVGTQSEETSHADTRHEHVEIQKTLKRFIDEEINPHVDEWEAAEIFPAHQVFKRLGELGLLGLTKPEEYGGAALDYSYSVAMAEALGHIDCGGVPMAIGVQTDMARPRWPASAATSCAASSSRRRSPATWSAASASASPAPARDVAGIKTHGAARTATTTSSPAPRCGSPTACRPTGCACWPTPREGAAHKNKSLIMVPMRDAKRQSSKAKKIRKIGMNVERHRPDLLRRGARAAALPHRRGRAGLHLPDAAVPGGAPVGGGALRSRRSLNCIQRTVDYARERKIFGKSVLDHQVVPLQARRAEDRGRVAARRWSTWRPRSTSPGQDVTELGVDGQAEGRPPRPRIVPDACMQYWGGMGYTWENPVSRHYRDGRLGSIGGGADEVMLGIIAKYMHTLPARR